MLELENRRLQQLVKQLQNGTTVPDSACKRIKSEQGVSVANDFSESAVHASHSQQQEIFYFPLATLTTLLLFLLATCPDLASVVPPVIRPEMIQEAPACVSAMLSPTLCPPINQWASRQSP